MIRAILASGLLLAMPGCNRGNLKYDKPYFDFDSLVTAQIKLVGLSNDSINKIAIIDGKTDVSQFMTDTAALKNELEIFRQLDVINKPLFKDAYSFEGDEKDAKSNLQVRTYRLKNSAKVKSAVPYVRFFFLQDFQHLKKIESLFTESNSLYSSHRNLSMEFDDIGKTNKLKRFSISGFQKMILNDSVRFSIEGIVY